MTGRMKNQTKPALPILLIDDDANTLRLMAMNLRLSGLNNIVTFESGADALEWIQENKFIVVVLDIIMPGKTGADVLSEIREIHPEVPVIMVSGLNDIETAISCMKKGARDYIVKPVESERLIASVTNAIEFYELQCSYLQLSRSLLSDTLENPDAFAGIKTNNDHMHKLFRYCEAISRTPYPVLITGETGTGKELFARAIHKVSGVHGEFVAVNVAGLDDVAFSDSLFGHMKGAYTGADTVRTGFVETAADGTLFLDEIGDLSLHSQVRLLRLLQEGEYMPLGTDTVHKSSCRILAATNQKLETLSGENGTFRSDLYYRLGTHQIIIPPLRERKEDLQPLLEWFLETTSEELKCKKPTYPPELLQLLSVYSFPGNVREFEGMVREAIINHRGGILSTGTFRKVINQNECPVSADISTESDACVTFFDKLPTLQQIEDALIHEAHKRAGGNQSVAASLIGITRQAFSYHLKKKAGGKSK